MATWINAPRKEFATTEKVNYSTYRIAILRVNYRRREDHRVSDST